MSFVNFREYKRHAVYTILLICLITLTNIIIIKYIKEEQNSSFDKISPVTQNELIQNSMIYR